ncbi:MAG: hypothetical protein ABJF01_13690 [bacterium]
MLDGLFFTRRTRAWRAATTIIAGVACLMSAACDSKTPPPPPASSAAAAASVAPATSGCPATGLWAECSVVHSLDRAGLAPHVDSGAKPQEKSLTGNPLVLTIGRTAQLEIFLYADSAARIADEAKLDRSALVNATAEQTIKRERTLIESVNVIGLLTSLSAHQRERVSDAITAGPPQPIKP